MTECPNCGGELKELTRERILPDPEFVEMSDDQLIEFFGEEITGEYEHWGADEITLECAQCGKAFRGAGRRNRDY